MSYRPYLRSSDLITAQDAVSHIMRLSDVPGLFTAKEGKAIRRACCDTFDVIDRERRQACRRGALEEWREARQLAIDAVYAAKTAHMLSTRPERLWYECYESVAKCIAFRHGARQRG